MDDETKKILERKLELFAPIDRQIMMTDDTNDLLLLSSNMCEAAFRIFINHYGVEAADVLCRSIFRIVEDTLEK